MLIIFLTGKTSADGVRLYVEVPWPRNITALPPTSILKATYYYIRNLYKCAWMRK